MGESQTTPPWKKRLDSVIASSGAREFLERPDVKRAVSAARDVSGEIVREVRGAGQVVVSLLDRRPVEDDLRSLKDQLQRLRADRDDAR